jgi:hypothetical protein
MTPYSPSSRSLTGAYAPEKTHGIALERYPVSAIRGWEDHIPWKGIASQHTQKGGSMRKALLVILGAVGAGFAHAITGDAWHWLSGQLIARLGG